MASGTSVTLHGVWGTSATNVFAVGDYGCVLHYDGTQWSLTKEVTPSNLYAVWGSSSSDVFAVGAFGTILHFDGTTWRSMASGTDYPLFDIWGSSLSNVFAGGSGAPVLHYDGSAWQDIGSRLIRPLTSAALQGIWGTSSSDVFLVGENTIVHFDGNEWELMPSDFSSSIRGLCAVSGNSPSDVYAVGYTSATTGAIMHYDGKAWTRLGPGTMAGLEGVWCSPSANVFAVGDKGTILHYAEGDVLAIEAISPAQGNQGDTLDATITGSSLTEVETVSFGDRITINELIVNSDAEIVVNVTIDSNAELGDRDVSVVAPGGRVTLTDGFTVEKDSAIRISSSTWVMIGTTAVLVVFIASLALVQRRPVKS